MLGRSAIFLQNGLIVFGALCLWAGFCRFHGRSEDRRLFAAVLGPYLAVHGAFIWVVEDIDRRAVALCVALVVAALLSARRRGAPGRAGGIGAPGPVIIRGA